MSYFESTTEKIDEIISSSEKYCFLVGAGISRDPPSCVPIASEIIKTVMDFTIPAEKKDSIQKLKISFENVIEIFQDVVDPHLKFLDFLEATIEPNPIHAFLAGMIEKGSIVLTTNFDYLLEEALLRRLKDKQKVLPVISDKDFEKYANFDDLFARGMCPVYKLHGSKKNWISGETIATSLITTISSFEKNSTDDKIFTMSKSKENVIKNALLNRTLIVMGYSGSDNFDIGPTLRKFGNVNKIIWIKHNSSVSHLSKVKQRIEYGKSEIFPDDDLIVRLSIQHKSKAFYVYEGNTSEFIRDHLCKILCSEGNSFETIPNPESPILLNQSPLNYSTWFQSMYATAITNFHKYRFAIRIFKASLKSNPEIIFDLANLALKESDIVQSPKTHGYFLIQIAQYYEIVNQPEQAVAYYRKAQPMIEKESDLENLATIYNGMGNYYSSKGDYKNALEHVEKAKKVAENIHHKEKAAFYQGNLGIIYNLKGDPKKGITYIDEGVASSDSPLLKVYLWQYKANILLEQAKYDDALEIVTKSNEILKALDVPSYYINAVINVAMIQEKKKGTNWSIQYLKDGLKEIEQRNDPDVQVFAYLITYKIGFYYYNLKQFNDAITNLSAIIPSAERNADFSTLVTTYQMIGECYFDQKQYSSAITYFKKGLEILNSIRGLVNMSPDQKKFTFLDALAVCYLNTGSPLESLNFLEQALELAKQKGYNDEISFFSQRVLQLKNGIAQNLSNEAKYNLSRGDVRGAILKFQAALEIVERAQISEGIIVVASDLAGVYFQMGDYGNARNYMERALTVARSANYPYIKDLLRNYELLKKRARF